MEKKTLIHLYFLINEKKIKMNLNEKNNWAIKWVKYNKDFHSNSFVNDGVIVTVLYPPANVQFQYLVFQKQSCFFKYLSG